MKNAFLLFVFIALVEFSSYSQCINQVTHLSGSVNVNGIQVTVSSIGHVTWDNLYCPNTFPYIIGSDGTFPNNNGSYIFQFSPPINSLTINFSGIGNQSGSQEIVKILINGSHYSIPIAGSSNSCDSLAILTPSGNITGCCSVSGWSGTTISGTISSLTVLDSIVSGNPNGALFSLYICNGNPTGLNKSNYSRLVISPNPSNGVFTINIKNATVQVYNISGQMVLQKALTQNSTIIDLTDYPKGIYFIKIENGNESIVKKIVYQ